MNFYLWIGPILAALVIIYVTYHVYRYTGTGRKTEPGTKQ